jgi:hypothetical protein
VWNGVVDANSKNAKMMYKHGRYAIAMAADGAIKVRPDEFLSMYSAAIHDDFCRVHDFGRLTEHGLQRIVNPNVLEAGETLYHLPTHAMWRGAQSYATHFAPPMRDAYKTELVMSALRLQFRLVDSMWDLIGNWITDVGYDNNAASTTEIVAEMAEWAGRDAMARSSSCPLIVVAGTLAVDGTLPPITQARTARVPWLELVSIAHALTAWTFDDPAPRFPTQRIRLARSEGHVDSVSACQIAWRAASMATLAKLHNLIAIGIHGDDLRALYCRAFGDERQDFCKTVVTALSQTLGPRLGRSPLQAEIGLLRGFSYPTGSEFTHT